MSFFGKARKEDLCRLVTELDLELPEKATIAKMKQLIVTRENYDEEFTESLIDTIIAERLENVAREKDILDREQRDKQLQLDREQRDKQLQLERERQEREFQLEKLKIETSGSRSQESSTNVLLQNKSFDLTKIIKSFDAKDTNADISTYLALFERQATRIGLKREDFVTHLLGLLPLDIAQIITREPETVSNDYDHIKTVLLKRFKLTPEQFRQKFLYHKKENASTWRDFAFELNHYFEEWITGLQVKEFAELTELIVADQLKRKVPSEIQTHFLDIWHKLKNVGAIVEKLEEYETARFRTNKTEISRESNSNQNKKYIPKAENNRTAQSTFRVFQNDNVNYNRMSKDNSNYNNVVRRKCYGCNRYGHKVSECKYRHKPEINNRTDDVEQKVVNQAVVNNILPKKIEKCVNILNYDVNAVLDTGSEVTIINQECYENVGFPPLTVNKICLNGIGNENVSPIGFFFAKIIIDNCVVCTNIYVLENLRFNAIIGMDVMSQLQFNFSNGTVNFSCVNLVEVVNTDKRIISSNKVAALPEFSKMPTLALMPNKQNGNQAPRCRADNCNQNIETGSNSTLKSLQKNRWENECETFLSFIANAIEEPIEVSHVKSQFRGEALDLIQSYKPQKIQSTDVKMNIILTDEIPIYLRSRRLPFAEQAIVEKQISEWLREGIIKPSCSDFAAPIVLCKKKDGSARLCVDYRKLNKKIVKDRFPLPLIEDVLDRLQGSEVFTTLDLKNGFFHVDIEKNSTKYTSFVTHEGQYEFLKVPFGLSNSPSVFQRYIFHVFKELLRDRTLIIYMDDIIIPAKDEVEGIQKLKRVLDTASKFGLELNFKKCQFLKRTIEFLGYIIEKGNIKPSPSKIAAVQNFPQPKSITQVQSYLGLTGYFRKFIKDYAKIARPLSDLLRDKKEFKFGLEQKQAFEELKKALTNDPVLHIYRQGAKLELHTDASSHGFGAILLQEADDGKMYPIQYMSKKTSVQQEKYCSYELEILAVIEALKKFRNYLLGSKFKIITDCSAFQKTMDKKDITPKIARWALFLEEFDYEIVHRPGNLMKHADALSRNVAVVVSQSQPHDEVTCKIAAAQQEDEHIKVIKELLEKGKEENYLVKNEVLYRYEAGRELLVVPLNMQPEIIKEVHNKGHFAVTKTEEVLKRDFYIPGLRKKIETVIANCLECILCNKKRGKGEGFLNPIPKEDIPLSTYHIDFIGPLPTTNKNYQHIFTVVDAFTKFIWLYPVKSTTTKDALDKLKNQQTTFGNPSRILSDRGSAFTSKEFTEYCKTENIDHIQITTGIPRGNGQIERMHETLIPVLSKLSIQDPTKWYKYVDSVQRIINSTIARSTKLTPFELLTGVRMRNKEDLEITEILKEEYANSFLRDREKLRKEAREKILKIQEENKRVYDRKRKKAYKYKIGELVAIQRTQFGTGLKLRLKYFGPYKIIKVKPNDRYDVEKVGIHEGPNLTSSAADNMKPWSIQN